ncbi:MAG TPA: hypothetical protein GXZ77_06455 [Papillibacter sp.]|jgi:predicted enzyme related to lactoylglutathione lyase|nr:hypothetical protein [Papillibacter sp.]
MGPFDAPLKSPNAVRSAAFYARMLGWSFSAVDNGAMATLSDPAGNLYLTFQTDRTYTPPPPDCISHALSPLCFEVENLCRAGYFALLCGGEIVSGDLKEDTAVLRDIDGRLFRLNRHIM